MTQLVRVQGVQSRRVCVPSEYAGFGIRGYDGLPDSKTTKLIRDFIDVATFTVGRNDDGQHLGHFINHDIADKLHEADETLPILNAIKAMTKKADINHILTFDTVPTYAAYTPDALAILNTYAAICTGQAFVPCDNCGAIFARSVKGLQFHCTDKCRSRQSDIARRARLGVLGKPPGRSRVAQ